MNRFIILFLFSLGILSTCVFAVEVIPLNEGWNFHRGFQAPASEIVKVTLPHTWNAGDGMFGNADYYRGLCNYSRKLSVLESDGCTDGCRHFYRPSFCDAT